MPPLFCSAKDLAQSAITKDIVVEKRKEYIRMLNDDYSDMDCKRCLMVEHKRYGDISFSRLGISTCSITAFVICAAPTVLILVKICTFHLNMTPWLF